IQAGDFKNFGADLIAGNDMTINADNVEIGTLVSTVGGITERHTTSSLLANNIIINSNNDAKFTSVNMEATNNLSISATNNVIFDVAQNKDFSKRESSSISLDFSNGSIVNTYKHTTTSITTTSSIGNSLKGGVISINAGKDLESYNMQVQSKGDIALNAGGNVTVGIKADQVIEEDRVTTKKISWNENGITREQTTEKLPARVVSSNGSSNDFVSGGNIVINSGGNSSFTSISLDANKKVEINSQGDVAFDTVTKNVHTTSYSKNGLFSSISRTDSVVQISNSLNGESVSINSGKNLTANNLGIQAKNDVVLKADGDITLTTKEDKHHTERFFTGKKEDKTDLTDYNVQAINGNNITISAGQNAHLSSVDIGAEKDLSISATGDVLLDTLVKKQVDTTKTESTKVGWFKTTKTTTTTITTTNTNIANNLSGNSISISSKKDLTGFNVKADAKENLTIEADGNLTLSTNADTKNIQEHKEEKTVGIFVHKETTPIRENVGISIGTQVVKTDTNTTHTTHNNQTLSANNITLSSGNKTALESVDTKSENISISGKDVTITALSDSYDQTIHKDTTTKTFGIGASVNTNAWGANVGMGYEERETKYDKETHNTSTSSANINANNITITTADKKGNPQGDINIIGSNLNGSEIALSGKDVNIKAHQTTNKITESEETIISHRGGLNILGLGGGSILSGAGMYGILGDFFGLKPTSSSEKIASNKINTGSNLVGNNINITTANNKGNTQGNINIVGSNLSATNEINLTAKNVSIKGSQDTYINGGYGFGYDVLDSFNTPSILDIEAYAQAKANASLDTKVNNSSITSNTINITSEKPKYSLTGGNTTIAGGNLSGENININSGNNLTIKTQKEIHANLNAGMNVIAESMGSAGLVVPVDFRGNIENGESNKELKDALQISLSSSSGKQSDIQAGSLNIDTKNNTTLSGSHIGAENGTISTGILTEKELVHQGFQIAQRLDDGRDIWGQYGSPIKGVFTMDQILKVINAGGDIKNKPFESLDKIGDSLRLGDFNLKGNMSLSKATHQATISQGIDIKTTNTKKPSSEIKRGEAQSQSQMQITKSQSEDTNVKKLAEDVIGLVNGINKVTKDKK
ncbi:hemagglutinin repeat-containing protein, partial [uncultured Helicobacter sp.]|uniref:hemagglutinin repeat-containing protein n=1 Tax=uncultured Helicobacter sp. TaxID=175537 RepID=UPI002604214C